MSEFKGVTVTREANVYFDGKVTSRAVTFEDGTVKTLGIMLPGDYEFGTAKAETMEIMAGELETLLPGNTEWLTVSAGGTFDIPADSKFSLKVKALVDYCCSYHD